MIMNDISPRTQAYADRRLLTRAVPNNILGQFGQSRSIPKNAGTVIIFRRYNKLSPATTPLMEGVTPTGKVLTKTDVQAMLAQYGDFVTITDVIRDTHEDPILKENLDILGEQAGETWDLLRAGFLTAGTNVFYANGTARSAVNSIVTTTLLRKAERALLRQEAKPLTSIIKAGPDIGTSPVAAAFFAVCHADCKFDLDNLTGWVGVHEYASHSGLVNGEIGAWGPFRFVVDNNLAAWADAGGTKGNMISTSGTKADVYPILIFGKDAYGVVTLGGKGCVQTIVNNLKGSDSDPLAQRGTCGWKGWTAGAILQDLWMLRLEVACTA